MMIIANYFEKLSVPLDDSQGRLVFHIEMGFHPLRGRELGDLQERE